MELHVWRPWRMKGKVRVCEGDPRNRPVEREQRKNKGTEPQPPNQRVRSQAGAGEHGEWKGHQGEGREGGAGGAGGRQARGNSGPEPLSGRNDCAYGCMPKATLPAA